MNKKSVFVLVSFGVLLSVFLLGPAVIGGWVFQNVEKSLNMPVEGRFEARWGQTSFTIHNASLEWDHKVRLHSADIEVHYELFSLLSSQGMAIQLKSRDFPVVLMGELAHFSPKSDIRVSDFYADLIIGPEGLKEIRGLKVESPEFQFNLEAGRKA